MNLQTHQYNLKGEYIRSFNSIQAAAEFHGVNESSIRRVIDKYPARGSGGNYWASKKVTTLDFDKGETPKSKNDFPKILIFDIETSPLRSFIWRRFKENIGNSQMISESFMLTWAAKWLFSPDVTSDGLTPQEASKENDIRIVQSLWKLMDEADIVVAHNGRKFDIPRVNNRLLVHNINPPSPFQIVDTLEVAKKLGFSSNSLDSVNKALGLDQKIKTDFDLWAGCMKGEKQSLKDMLMYNKQDVEILEQTYLRLRPWMKSKHPNVGLFMDTDDPVCYVCGSKKLIPNGYYYTAVGEYQAYKCQNCGAPNRGRYTQIPLSKRKKLVRNTAR